tara:strand:+ start:776 stop:928 length:153 start_codon:yes stop_codon:yes gene_type:complete
MTYGNKKKKKKTKPKPTYKTETFFDWLKEQIIIAAPKRKSFFQWLGVERS